MPKRLITLSLGGSLIVPEQIDFNFLREFKQTLESHYKTHKFVVICGGGTIARKYIEVLKKQGASVKEQSLAGIRATRMNAQFMMQFFSTKEANDALPLNMKQVKSNLQKNKVVFCGALRYSTDSTSDKTAVKLANFLGSQFINMTNVKGLYTSDPKKNPKAKFIPRISWHDFEKMALKLKYEAGQHFVLDQGAATLIRQNKIPAYIIGSDLKNLTKILDKKRFEGTSIID